MAEIFTSNFQNFPMFKDHGERVTCGVETFAVQSRAPTISMSKIGVLIYYTFQQYPIRLKFDMVDYFGT